MSRKTVAFAKKLNQAMRKGRTRSDAVDVLTPSNVIVGEGRATKGAKEPTGKGSTVTRPRRKPPVKLKG